MDQPVYLDVEVDMAVQTGLWLERACTLDSGVEILSTVQVFQ